MYRALERDKHVIILTAMFQGWKNAIGKDVEQPVQHSQLHYVQCQEAMTFEVRQQLDHDFRKIKQRDWRTWIKNQVDSKVQAAQGVRTADLYRILQPKKMKARSSGKLLKALPGL